MLVTMGRKEWSVLDEDQLHSVLQTRDLRDGAEFWLTHASALPALNLRLYDAFGCATYFPNDKHPGFRCYGGQNLESERTTTFVFDGCEPRTGEEEPNEFVMDTRTAFDVAREFLHDPSLPESFEWFEL